MAQHKLIIVESPAKARTITKFLGRGYKVEASQGHIRDLPKSQIGVDEENNFEPKYITIRGRGEILTRIRKEAKAAKAVFLATDPDREGEAISWHLANILGIDPSTPCRVKFHEITEKEIKAAIKKPEPLDLKLVDAQQARRVLDRLVGYKISPLLWRKVRQGLSAGRVQSVATSMIVEREREIESFETEEYWTIGGEFKGFTARYQGMNGEKAELKSSADCENLVERLRTASYTVNNIKRGERKKHPAPPFTTSNLQQEASRKLGFTTSKTMQIAQQLYEGVDIQGVGTQGIVSYIRTDSTRISDEAIASIRDAISARFGENYLPAEPNTYKSRKSAQDAHEAIRPTNTEYRPEVLKASLTRDQYRLYKLIYDRFIASQMTPAIYDTLSAEIVADTGDRFTYSGQHKRFAGFTIVYEEGQDDTQEEADTALPLLENGDSATLVDVHADQHFTQPPPRYTEASLVHAMEDLGIGRPSTYAPTISTITMRGYITRKNKRLEPTELGIVVTDMMSSYFPDIVDTEFTADMERDLDDIEAGSKDWHNVISEFYGPFKKTLEIADQSIEKVEIEDQVSDIPCEKCGAMMVYKTGRFGRFLACPNFPNCRHTQALLKTISTPCPECGGKLFERVSKRGRRFYGCEHYPECQFVSWDQPVEDKCPDCSSRMVFKRTSKGDTYHLCTNESCKKRVPVAAPEDE
ncbi:MAG: type I DNA topoisomerase [Clostridiales bacterium]|nr:type I DNA topoisomerase [Clostridiales bacterium]